MRAYAANVFFYEEGKADDVTARWLWRRPIGLASECIRLQIDAAHNLPAWLAWLSLSKKRAGISASNPLEPWNGRIIKGCWVIWSENLLRDYKTGFVHQLLGWKGWWCHDIVSSTENLYSKKEDTQTCYSLQASILSQKYGLPAEREQINWISSFVFILDELLAKENPFFYTAREWYHYDIQNSSTFIVSLASAFASHCSKEQLVQQPVFEEIGPIPTQFNRIINTANGGKSNHGPVQINSY